MTVPSVQFLSWQKNCARDHTNLDCDNAKSLFLLHVSADWRIHYTKHMFMWFSNSVSQLILSMCYFRLLKHWSIEVAIYVSSLTRLLVLLNQKLQVWATLNCTQWKLIAVTVHCNYSLMLPLSSKPFCKGYFYNTQNSEFPITFGKANRTDQHNNWNHYTTM